MSIEKIVKYLAGALDERFQKEACSAILERNPKLLSFDFQGATSVKVPSIQVSGLGTYSRSTGYPAGTVSVGWQTFTITNDRGVKFNLDFVDNEETDGLLLGQTANEFSRTKEIPEVDAVRFAKLAQGAYADNIVSATPSASDVISKFNDAIKALEDNEVPVGANAVFFISTGIDKLLKESTQLTHYITQGDFKAPNGITYKLRMYEESPIVVVPPHRFYSAVELSATGDDTFGGYSKPLGAVALNFMYVNLSCSFPVMKHRTISMISPENNPDFDSYLLKVRAYHDLFLPTNKTYGVYVSKAIETYTVVFNANTGAGTMANQTITVGTSTALTSNSFTKASNTFVKWNTAADGTGTDYADGASVLNIAAGGASITLYAQWTAA